MKIKNGIANSNDTGDNHKVVDMLVAAASDATKTVVPASGHMAMMESL